MAADRTIVGLDGLTAVNAVGRALMRIDPRLVDHGERVAFIADEMLDEGALPLAEDPLLLLCAFHDIGAYKTEEIDRMVEFETRDVEHHAIYGYLFLKYMSPLANRAEAILYHHTPWRAIADMDGENRDYAALIHLADRIDIAFLHGGDDTLFACADHGMSGLFRPEYVELARRCFAKRQLFARLGDGSYRQAIARRIARARIDAQLALEYLKMLVFAIDFRSEYTVTHTINTVSIALYIAEHFGLNDSELDAIYLGTLLHDVGKIAIPVDILEHPGSLTADQMAVMRTHVSQTGEIIRGIVPSDVFDIATRHHEKLDGSGYPFALTARDLTFSQRIVAVADIISALVSKRSYKEPFPKEKTIAILTQMRESQLDPRVCDYICREYDRIIACTDNSRNDVVRAYQAMLDEYRRLRRTKPDR